MKEKTEEMMRSFPKLKGLGVERISQLYHDIPSIFVGLKATEDGHSIIMDLTFCSDHNGEYWLCFALCVLCSQLDACPKVPRHLNF